MKTFLEYVANDLIAKHGTDLSRVAVVFPNKRASLFLTDFLAHQAAHPLWSPAYMTISDLFRSHSRLQVADPIKLVCDLHKCFTKCTGIDETLDHFYGWGQLLLADFDDIDKNMADADKVFANLRNIHELDDISYLTEEQREMIRRFFSNFSEDQNTELKQRFLRLWSHISDIYSTFRQLLSSQQLAYEGALYRQVATDDSVEFKYDTYVFIGFNLLDKVEQTLFRRLRSEGKARFYWDFDKYYMSGNEAGHYIAQYLSDFPNELDTTDEAIYGNFSRRKQITFISAPTENIQARYIGQWLTQERIRDGRRTAIVLSNEGLLQSVIHCLPDQVEKVNVTTGYPLSQTPVASLVSQLMDLHIYGRSKASGRLHTRRLGIVERHPYRQYFNMSDTLPEQILPWLAETVRQIAVSIAAPDDLTQESLFRMYTLLNRLNDLTTSGDLQADNLTLQRLLIQITSATTIPFHGEPAEGLQVMGVLETRNLDFDHILLLSANEGNMPRGAGDTSFIPYTIRKAYGLTTIDNKVAIYAYYFHRLLQRASDVTLVYNNSTNEGQTGEMSRFMLQLMVESPHPIRFHSLKSGDRRKEEGGRRKESQIRQPLPIAKTPEVMRRLTARFSPCLPSPDSSLPSPDSCLPSPLFTPTAISNYLRCPLRFFYHYVCGIQEEGGRRKEEGDAIDNRTFGNIFHQAAQTIYERLGNNITRGALEHLLKNAVDIERAVDEAIRKEVFQTVSPASPMPPLDGLQLIGREVIIRYLRHLLEVDARLAPFTILGLEKRVQQPFSIGRPPFSLLIGGYIDRLDMIRDPATGRPRIRVVDYKTGSTPPKAFPDVESLFDPNSVRDHGDYYLQAFIYSHIVRTQQPQPAREVSPALLFIQHAGGVDYDPTLVLGREPVRDIATVDHHFTELLTEKIDEIFNPAVSFSPTCDRSRCLSCPYAPLCR